MGDDKKYERLLGRANRALSGRAVDEAVGKVRAIVGVPHVPETETAAQAALDKLKAGKRPTAAELAALEFVIRMMRPAPLSRKGLLDPLPAAPGSSVYNPDTVKLWDNFRQTIKSFIYSVGRVDMTAGPSPETGTAFLVGEDLLLTNHHVLSMLSSGADELDEGQAVVRFYQEAGSVDPSPGEYPIVGVVAVHPTLDMALLRVKLPATRPVLALETGTVSTNEQVATIGYPFKDDRNPIFMDAVFGAFYGVKRGAIGEIVGAGTQTLFHDCSTLGGNSGSPLFSMTTGRVIGLHFSGFFMYRNEAVPAADVAAFVHSATGGN